MPTLNSRIVAASVSLFVSWVVVSSARGAAPLDLSYLPADTVAVFVIHPRQILTAPQLEMLPVELVTNFAKAVFGVTPTNIEEVVCFISRTGLEDGSPGMGARFKFIKPFNPRTLAERLAVYPIGKVTDVKIQDQECLLIETPNGLSLYLHLANPTTLLLATDGQVEQMLGDKKAEGPFLSRLKKIDASKSAAALIDVTAVRPLIRLATQTDAMPEELVSLLKALDLVKFAQLTIDVQDVVSLDLALDAANVKNAAELKQRADDAIAMALASYEAQIGAVLDQVRDPVPQSIGQYARRMLKKSLAETRISLAGNTVSISTSRSVADVMVTGALVTMLLPVVQDARQSAKYVQSLYKLSRMGLAIAHYHQEHDGTYPTSAILDKQGKPLLSWRVAILPYIPDDPLLGESLAKLYKEFHLDEPWDSKHNRTLLAKIPPIFGNGSDGTKTNFLAVVGKGTAISAEQGTQTKDFKDDTSNTIVAVEVDDDYAVEWTRPDDLELDPKHPLDGLGHLRAGRFVALMADGAIRSIERTIDPDVLRGLITIAGGEDVAVP